MLICKALFPVVKERWEQEKGININTVTIVSTVSTIFDNNNV